MDREALLAELNRLSAQITEVRSADATDESTAELAGLTVRLNAATAQLNLLKAQETVEVTPERQVSTRRSLASEMREAGALVKNGPEIVSERSALDVFTLAGDNAGTGNSSYGNVPEYDPTIQRRFRRPLDLLDVIPVFPMGADTLVYFQVSNFTNNAGSVPKRVTEDGVEKFGKYAQSGLKVIRKSIAVSKIGTYVEIDEDTLKDVPQIEAIINDELPNAVREEVQAQLLAPTKADENDLEPLWTGAQEHTFETGADANATTRAFVEAIRKAATKTRKVAGDATFVAMTDEAWEAVELLKNANDDYQAGGPFSGRAGTIWGLTVITSPGLDRDDELIHGLVGASTYVGLGVRDDLTTAVGQPDDLFLRDALAIKARIRAALRNRRPEQFVHVVETAPVAP